MIVLRHYQRRSANTRRLYARELLLFLAYCESRGQDPYAVRAEHVEDYLAVLSGAGLAEASLALALAAISAYYDRAVHAGAIDANPCAIVERPKPAAEEQNQARALCLMPPEPPRERFRRIGRQRSNDPYDGVSRWLTKQTVPTTAHFW